ncbi:MAG TPA: tetratricopeptide repeat protein [Chthoniobacterales bacterium]|nr:tetratricopeptide repeat protein [Chthoniobacterales bacterium]
MATAPTPTSTAADPLIETQVFWMRHKNTIIIAIVVLLLAIAAYGAYRFISERAEAAAATQLANAKTAADFQKVIVEHPGSNAAPSAALLLAAEQRKDGKFAEANTTLQSFIDRHPNHQLVTTAQMAIAANYDSMGRPDDALETYRRIAADHSKTFNAPLAMISQVPLLKAKGQIDEARRVCETVMTQYANSFASQEAQRYLKTLKPAASAAAAAAVSAPAAAPAENSPPPVAPSP